MAPLSMSKTEARLFDQVCETLQVSSEIQKNMLKSFIYDDLNSDWTDLVSLMEANGPLSMLSEEQLKYHQTRTHKEVDSLSQSFLIAGQETVDPGLVKAATHDIHQYNNALEKLLVKYRDYVRRSIANIQRYSSANTDASTVDQKIVALSRKKDMLRAEIHKLDNKIRDHTSQLDGVNRTEPSIIGTNDYLKQVSETLPSYDHILNKLNVLYGELGHDTFDDDTVIQTARRHASQIVLSLATKCRASLDTVFLEASTSNKRKPYVSDSSRIVDDERGAVYAEIQSLWDEMVPLAHMVVEKEFLKPIINKIELFSERQGGRDATVFLYTSAMLRFMNERLLLLADRIGMLASHHQILFETLAQVNSIAEPTPISSLGDTGTPLIPPNGSNKPVGRTLLEIIRRQMELYGSVPIDVDKQPQTSRAPRAQMQAHNLDQYVISRQRKGDDLARNVHQSFERAAKSELTDAELGVHLLLDAITVDSDAGFQTNGQIYEDQQVEDSVATMRSQAEEIQTIFRKLREEPDGVPLSASDFVTYAYNKAAKQRAPKDNEGSRLNDQEECAKFVALVHKWGESSSFTS